MDWNRKLAAGLAALVLACSSLHAAGPQEGLVFQGNLTVALASAAQSGRVTVVYFHGNWCQWCRKMQATTFTDRRITALAGRFVWVSVDSSRQAELAAAFGVRGVPQVVLLNVRGEVVASRGGYMTAGQMLAMLRNNADKAQAPGEGAAPHAAMAKLASDLASATQPAQRHAAVLEALEQLAEARRGARQVLLDGAASLPREAWDALADCLEDPRLAVRAAAGEALQAATGAEVAFDPFADAADRPAQAAAWRQWIAANRDKPIDRPPPATMPAELGFRGTAYRRSESLRLWGPVSCPPKTGGPGEVDKL